MKTTQRFYVDLDSLHDTRHGLLLEHWPWLLSKVNFSKYIHRVSDNWVMKIGIALDDWEKAWGARSNETLMQSPPTVFLYELVRELRDKNMAVDLGAPLMRPELTVNTYPYKFTKEQSELYQELLEEWFGSVCAEVTLIHIGPEMMTAEFVTESFESATMFEWRKWIASQIEFLKKNPVPSFVLNGPALLDTKAALEVSNQIVEDKINPFTEAKDFLSGVLTLNLFDSEAFSLRLPSSQKNETNLRK